MLFDFVMSALMSVYIGTFYNNYGSQYFSPGRYSSITLKTFNTGGYGQTNLYNGQGFKYYISFYDFDLLEPLKVNISGSKPNDLTKYDFVLGIEYKTFWTQSNTFYTTLQYTISGKYSSNQNYIAAAKSLKFYLTANAYHTFTDGQQSNNSNNKISTSFDFYKDYDGDIVSNVLKSEYPGVMTYKTCTLNNLDISLTLQDKKGYDIGYSDGYTIGYNVGNETGYNNGYTIGYSDGSQHGVYSTNWVSNIFGAVSSFLQMQLFPGFKLVYVITIPVVIALVGLVLRFFR